MKKLIAMLLCVAMIAALSVNAFAGSKLVTKSTDDLWEKVSGKSTSSHGYTRNYAENLKDAQKYASDKKSDATKTLKAVKDAVAVIQNYALGEAYKTMIDVVDVAVEDAVNQFAWQLDYDYSKNILDKTPESAADVQAILDKLSWY